MSFSPASAGGSQNRPLAEFQHHNQVFHRTIVEASGNQVLLRVWDSLAFEVRTRFVMDFLTTVAPVVIAREHEPVVDALDRREGERAAGLLRCHSSGLVRYLRDQAAAASPAQATAAEPSSPRRRTSPAPAGKLRRGITAAE